MGNTRYQLTEMENKNITAKLLYVSSSRYEGDWPSLKHTHYFTELFYVRKGGGNFIVEDKIFPIAKDDLVIINPNVAHTEISLDTTPLEYIIIGVESLIFSFGDNDDYIYFSCKNSQKNLLFYFISMLKEMEQKEKKYELVCQNLLKVLIINLMRHTDYAFEIAPTQKASRECGRIKRYIDSNFSDDITLDSLAKMAHLNKYYLIHVFTKYYGFSPISYLNEKRIQSSKELLLSTNHTIAEVAQLSGFSSQSYFAQSFRKACGMTAGKYRKCMKKQRD